MATPDASRSHGRERNPIASIVRVLDAMVESEASSFGVRELARSLGAPPSSVHRTLESGAAVSLVRASASGQWELGWELYRIASLAQRKQPFLAVAELLDALRDLTAETAFLAVYDPRRHQRMYVAASPSRRSVQFVPRLFTWLPLHATASAMAVLAHRSAEERKDLYQQGLPIFSGRSQTPPKVERIMASIRSEGFALSRDQADVGASAIAAPVRTAGSVNSSIGVAVPNQRFDEATHANLAGEVIRAAEDVSRRVGDPLSAADGR
ncbi:MAG: IclR family transcriptional regulator [Acidimicrobiales bacterium]